MSVTLCDNGGMTEEAASLPRDADGFYRMWIIRYVADGRTEEIHIPAYGEPDEHRLVRRRAKEVGTAAVNETL